MTTFYVEARGDRPDFRIVLTFVWSEDHNLDTDGDSDNPASRTWTELYARNRECEQETFVVDALCESPLVLKVRADLDYLAARVAWFLAIQTSGGVAESPAGPFLPPDTIEARLGDDFDLRAAVERAAASRLWNATLENPYPEK